MLWRICCYRDEHDLCCCLLLLLFCLFFYVWFLCLCNVVVVLLLLLLLLLLLFSLKGLFRLMYVLFYLSFWSTGRLWVSISRRNKPHNKLKIIIYESTNALLVLGFICLIYPFSISLWFDICCMLYCRTYRLIQKVQWYYAIIMWLYSNVKWYKYNHIIIYVSLIRVQFHNTLIRLRFNPIYFMQNYTYLFQTILSGMFKAGYKVYLWIYIHIGFIC